MQLPRTTTVRFLPRERLIVEAAAAGQGVGPSTYIRRAALAAARRELAREPAPEPAES
jgi:hypothetical protein